MHTVELYWYSLMEMATVAICVYITAHFIRFLVMFSATAWTGIFG
jgi:hypothetical protein